MAEPGSALPLQGQDFGPRMRGTVIVKPIVYGNVSRYFGATREDGHTHEWTVYLKSYENEDMRGYVRKVHFKLHDSYANPNRVFTEPPYSVQESGWGEFEVVIKVYFYDTTERPITIYHQLKLFNTPPASTEYPLVSETYDELIFADPSSWMYDKLTSAPLLPPQLQEVMETDFEERQATTLALIKGAKVKVGKEIEEFRAKIEHLKEAIAKLKKEMAAKNAAAAATSPLASSSSTAPATPLTAALEGESATMIPATSS